MRVAEMDFVKEYYLFMRIVGFEHSFIRFWVSLHF